MFHRIRYALGDAVVEDKLSGTVEADETYIGGRRRGTKRGRPGADSHKAPVVSLVERGGKVRSTHMQRVTAENIDTVLQQQVNPMATLMTDEYGIYNKPGKKFAGHGRVQHGLGEYVRGDAHVNTAEGFFSLLKRGLNGTYHHVGKQHLGQYLSEFDFRYNTRGLTDGQRTAVGIRKVGGKRLMLHRSSRPV